MPELTHTTCEIISETRRLACELNRPPLESDFAQQSEIAPEACLDEFDEWGDLLREAGLEGIQRPHNPPESLLGDLRRGCDKSGTLPTEATVEQLTGNSPAAYKFWFGTVQQALIEIGHENNESENAFDESSMLDDIRRVSDYVDRWPTPTDMRTYGEYSPNAYQYCFGSFSTAVSKAVVDTY